MPIAKNNEIPLEMIKPFPLIPAVYRAIDGTHVPAWVAASEQARFRNRKGFISQNVMAVVGFDSRFHYVLAGWEGSATDSRVLYNALDHPTDPFVVPEGTTTKMIPRQKYYVVFEGRSRGIYNSWEQCQPLVYRYKGAMFRSFHTYEAAEYQMNEYLHNKYGVQFCRPLDIVDIKATKEKEMMKTNGRINNQVFWIAFFFYLFCLLDLYSLNFYVLDGTHVIW
ncbi:hypothetical protein EJ110_NYTH52685 [Nymphaea thermarum]|nr:hypothetical protein EJ110_NYTH52685 [Nymphaea thermarum]